MRLNCKLGTGWFVAEVEKRNSATKQRKQYRFQSHFVVVFVLFPSPSTRYCRLEKKKCAHDNCRGGGHCNYTAGRRPPNITICIPIRRIRRSHMSYDRDRPKKKEKLHHPPTHRHHIRILISPLDRRFQLNLTAGSPYRGATAAAPFTMHGQSQIQSKRIDSGKILKSLCRGK